MTAVRFGRDRVEGGGPCGGGSNTHGAPAGRGAAARRPARQPSGWRPATTHKVLLLAHSRGYVLSATCGVSETTLVEDEGADGRGGPEAALRTVGRPASSAPTRRDRRALRPRSPPLARTCPGAAPRSARNSDRDHPGHRCVRADDCRLAAQLRDVPTKRDTLAADLEARPLAEALTFMAALGVRTTLKISPLATGRLHHGRALRSRPCLVSAPAPAKHQWRAM